jgi:hypothetical protein
MVAIAFAGGAASAANAYANRAVMRLGRNEYAYPGAKRPQVACRLSPRLREVASEHIIAL